MARDRDLSDRGCRAFALRELIACAAVISTLALLALPASGNSRSTSHGVVCLANLRHLAAAMQVYTYDNRDVLPENYTGGDAQGGTAGRDPRKSPWAGGWLDWTQSPDNTNTALIRDRRFARLSPYLRPEINVHKCPADVFLSAPQRSGGWRERVRSVSLNATIGVGNAVAGPLDPQYVQIRSIANVASQRTRPSDLSTFLDEHPNSINDPVLFPPSSKWIDLPGSLHKGAGAVAFLDGRVELHSWLGSLRTLSARSSWLPPVEPLDPDITWLQLHSARR